MTDAASIADSSSVLPPLYAGWIDSLLRSPIPSEPYATCDDCAMCAPEGTAGPASDSMYFSPRIKCCTYLPQLPNFLVGRALEDDDFAFSAGRATLEARIDAGIGVSPLGLEIPTRYSLLYENGTAGFGRAQSMRCPHYLEEAGGRCGVWKHRNAICATWFCKHERGAAGMLFWHRIRDLLTAIESSLAAWCVLQSGLGREQIDILFPPVPRHRNRRPLSASELDLAPDAAERSRMWGRLLGSERDFFRQCGRRVTALGWKEVLSIGGGEAAVRARIVQSDWEALSRTRLPVLLRPGPFEMAPVANGGVRIVSYSATDPLDLTAEAFEILRAFGGPNARSVSRVEKELGRVVEGDLVRTFLDFEILVPSDDTGG